MTGPMMRNSNGGPPPTKDTLNKLLLAGATLRHSSSEAANQVFVMSNSSVFDVGARTPTAAASGDSPLFHSSELNRAVISKVIAPKDADLIVAPNRIATKIFIPYADESAKKKRQPSSITGRYLFFGQRNFDSIMNTYFLGGLLPEQKYDDLRVLQALHEIPSLDAFLIKDKFASMGIPASDAYTSISESDWYSIRTSILDDFRPLVSRAFGVSTNLEEKAIALIDKLWDASDLEGLAPLTKALRLDDNQAPVIYKSWKGIIYYKHRYKHCITAVTSVTSALQSAETAPQPRKARRLDWQSIHRALHRRVGELELIFSYYNRCLSQMWDSQDKLNEFIHFLRSSPNLFWIMGAHMVALDSAVLELQKLKSLESKAGDLTAVIFDALHGILVSDMTDENMVKS